MALNSNQEARKEYLETLIAAVDKALLSGIKGGQSMTIGGRSIQRYSPSELNRLRSKHAKELENLEALEQKAPRKLYSSVKVRF